jgi:hypothetical protein
MKRGCFRVSPNGADVMGVVVRPVGAITRCVSLADTSLSLSLSLYSGSPSQEARHGAEERAGHHPLAGHHRAPGRGIRRCCCGVSRGLFERRCDPHPAALEEVPSRIPTRAGTSSTGRRGPTDLGPRRPNTFHMPSIQYACVAPSAGTTNPTRER